MGASGAPDISLKTNQAMTRPKARWKKIRWEIPWDETFFFSKKTNEKKLGSHGMLNHYENLRTFPTIWDDMFFFWIFFPSINLKQIQVGVYFFGLIPSFFGCIEER